MASLPGVRAIRQAVGFGKIFGPIAGGKPHHRVQYLWQVSRREHIMLILNAMLPYLRVKGKEARIMLRFLEITRVSGLQRYSVH